jgi:hypothetical protein
VQALCVWSNLYERASYVPRGCCTIDWEQVALMGVLADVVAALDVHRGIVEVASNGLGFLMCLAVAQHNKVTPFM